MPYAVTRTHPPGCSVCDEAEAQAISFLELLPAGPVTASLGEHDHPHSATVNFGVDTSNVDYDAWAAAELRGRK